MSLESYLCACWATRSPVVSFSAAWGCLHCQRWMAFQNGNLNNEQEVGSEMVVLNAAGGLKKSGMPVLFCIP